MHATVVRTSRVECRLHVVHNKKTANSELRRLPLEKVMRCGIWHAPKYNMFCVQAMTADTHSLERLTCILLWKVES